MDALALEVATAPGGPAGPFVRELIVARIDTDGLPTNDLLALRTDDKVLEVIDSRGAGGHEISTWSVRVRTAPGGHVVKVLFYRDKSHQQIRGARDITMADAVEAVKAICEAAKRTWPGIEPRITGASYNTLNATLEIALPSRPEYAKGVSPLLCEETYLLDVAAMGAALQDFRFVEGEGLAPEVARRYGGRRVTFIHVQPCSGGTSVRAEAIVDGAVQAKNPKVTVSSMPKLRVMGGHSLEQLALVRLALNQILEADRRRSVPALLRAPRLPETDQAVAGALAVVDRLVETGGAGVGAWELLGAAERNVAEALAYDPASTLDGRRLRSYFVKCRKRVVERSNNFAVDKRNREGEEQDEDESADNGPFDVGGPVGAQHVADGAQDVVQEDVSVEEQSDNEERH